MTTPIILTADIDDFSRVSILSEEPWDADHGVHIGSRWTPGALVGLVYGGQTGIWGRVLTRDGSHATVKILPAKGVR